MTAALILRLTTQANVNSRFVFFQDADSNLRTAPRGLDECFFLVNLPRYISVIAERFFFPFLALAGSQAVSTLRPVSRPQIQPAFPLDRPRHSSPRPVAHTPAKMLQTLLSFPLLLFLAGTMKARCHPNAVHASWCAFGDSPSVFLVHCRQPFRFILEVLR